MVKCPPRHGNHGQHSLGLNNPPTSPPNNSVELPASALLRHPRPHSCTIACEQDLFLWEPCGSQCCNTTGNAANTTGRPNTLKSQQARPDFVGNCQATKAASTADKVNWTTSGAELSRRPKATFSMPTRDDCNSRQKWAFGAPTNTFPASDGRSDKNSVPAIRTPERLHPVLPSAACSRVSFISRMQSSSSAASEVSNTCL